MVQELMRRVVDFGKDVCARVVIVVLALFAVLTEIKIVTNQTLEPNTNVVSAAVIAIDILVKPLRPSLVVHLLQTKLFFCVS